MPSDPSSPNQNQIQSTKNLQWQLKSRSLHFREGPCVMGIVNVTPDSFSDGGRHNRPDDAVEHALKLAQQGAGILDIGGESTRPYSDPVAVDEELSRVMPVIEALVKSTDVPISIDTSKSKVAAAAVAAGAEIINDVTGLEGDPGMIDVAVNTGAGICAMHMQGNPQTMQVNPEYKDVTNEIMHYLASRKDALVAAGISPPKICLDPGIGFGKTHQHNLQLIRDCGQFLQLGCPVLVGHSRKGFLGKLLGDKTMDRDSATLAVSILLAQQGLQVIRVHEVQQTCQAMKVLRGVIQS